MDGFLVALWIVRLGLLGLLYLFLAAVARILLRDLRAAARGPVVAGRLVVLEAPGGDPAPGSVVPVQAVTTIGRDVNNDLVLADPHVSAEHAILTFRARTWFVEDLGSTNGTFLNGRRVDGIAELLPGDELRAGGVRLRLERGGG